MNKFPYMLRTEREKRDLNQNETAIQIGLLADTYRKYERGDREPDFETLVKIADFFKVSTDYLLGRYN